MDIDCESNCGQICIFCVFKNSCGVITTLSKNCTVQLQGKFEKLVIEVKSFKLIHLIVGYLYITAYIDFKVTLHHSEVQNHPHASACHG